MTPEEMIAKAREALATPLSMLIYGDLRTGKSTDVVSAFPGWSYILTNPTIHRPVASAIMMLAEKCQTEGKPYPDNWLQLPKQVITMGEHDQAGNTNSSYFQFEQVIEGWIAGCAAGKIDTPGLVIDEFSTVLDWADTDLKKVKGKSFNTSAEVMEFVRKISHLHQITGKGIICISHSVDPEFDESGKLLIPGGAKFPYKKQRRSFAQEFDVVMQLTLEKEQKLGQAEPKISRFYSTVADPNWVRGVRDFRTPAKVGVTDPREGGSSELRQLVQSLGFKV